MSCWSQTPLVFLLPLLPSFRQPNRFIRRLRKSIIMMIPFAKGSGNSTKPDIFYCTSYVRFYVLFRRQLCVNHSSVKYRGQKGRRAKEKMRRVLVLENPQESVLLIDAAAQHQGISQPHYEMCICRSSHSSAAPAWKPPAYPLHSPSLF